MKKILLLSLLLVLTSCSNQEQVNVNNKTSSQPSSGEKIVTTVENNKELVNKPQNNVDDKTNLPSSSGNTKENITEESSTTGESNVSTNINNKENVYWKKYEKRFKNFAEYLAGISDEYKRVNEILDIRCEEMCDLNIKNKLTEKQLEAANKCYKKCKKMQQDAQLKQKALKKEIENEKNQYPKKCILDAEKEYESFIKETEKRKNQPNMPGDFKIPSKEEFVKFSSEECLVSYGYVNRNCEVIKEYKNAYDKCKKVIEFERNMFFIEMWRGKTLEDFVLERKRFR